MRLIELTVTNFRGFGPSATPIDLSSDLVLIYAPNGHGKTSVAEAIEWLFYGTTTRRQRGEQFSRSEYVGTFANVHGKAPVEVCLRGEHNGREIVLSRRLVDNEKSQTFVDGVRADFDTVGIVAVEAHYPVVAQHGLQTFIHARPKDRRDAICSALGLEDLTTFKSALESARASFQRTPPKEVVDARLRLAQRASQLIAIPGLDELRACWTANPLVVKEGEDLDALLAATGGLTGVRPARAADAVELLVAARERAGRSVFDLSLIQPVADHDQASQDAKRQIKDLAAKDGSVDDRLGTLLAVSVESYSTKLLSFWSAGLELAPEGEVCPMCGESTLSQDHRLGLRHRLQEASDVVEAASALVAAVADWEPTVGAAGKAIVALALKGMDEPARENLKALLGDSEPLDRFLGAHDRLIEARRTLGVELRAAKSVGADTVRRAGIPSELRELTADRLSARQGVAAASELFFTALDNYIAAWSVIAPTVEQRISADTFVAKIDAVRDVLENFKDASLLVRYAEVLAETQSLVRRVESAAQDEQDKLLKSRGQEVKDIYALLNPGATVGFDTMEPANDAMKLHATSFGVRMPAAANLSECQLNCLGLAVWLMRATTPSSPFNFVLLDDPVQAMDDDHSEAFVSGVVPYLLDTSGKQLVILSHVKGMVDRLRQLNNNRRVRHYHIENYDANGPVIVHQIRLARALAEIKGAAAGNEDNRKFAIDRLRVLLEEFIRELHLKVVGSPPSDKYDTANSGELATLYRSIPGTTPDEYTRLKDTIGFCDPAHHTQAGYPTPIKSQIQPHIDRVEGIMKVHGLL
jgi:hypothetical protein